MNEGHDESLAKIRDIRRRIEEIRNTLRATQSKPVQPSTTVKKKMQPVDTARAAKNAEMDAIRKKLIGNKK